MSIHAAKIEHSAGLTRIASLLKAADYPLSAQDIAQQAYPNAHPPKVMLNVSTKIGEMRAQINTECGWNVSFASYWKVGAATGSESSRRNRDGSITYFIERATQPWHDGNARYYLIAAPGWRARWMITEGGLLVRSSVQPFIPQSALHTPHSNEPPAKTAPALSHQAAQPVNNIPQSDAPTGLCIKCGKQLQPDHQRAPICEECRGTLAFLQKEETACL